MHRPDRTDHHPLLRFRNTFLPNLRNALRSGGPVHTIIIAGIALLCVLHYPERPALLYFLLLIFLVPLQSTAPPNRLFSKNALILLVLTSLAARLVYEASADGLWVFLERLNKAYLFRYEEYLFFIGTLLAAAVMITRGKTCTARLLLACGILWITLHPPLVAWLKPLGVDSFIEARKFDIGEALFWLTTFKREIYPDLHLGRLIVYSSLALLFFGALSRLAYHSRWSAKRNQRVMLAIATLALLVGVQQTTSDSLSLITKNSKYYLQTKQNFLHAVPELSDKNREMTVIVYIGESTTTMNMSLYGYPRKTTPLLDRLAQQDGNFLQFANVLTTHTHTYPALLEALSISADGTEYYLPINERQRISVVDILAQAKVDVHLLSNQGQSGSSNIPSSILFKSATRVFSAESRLRGNFDFHVTKPWDHDFFVGHLPLATSGEAAKKVIFMHSYAGHGRYLRNIPQDFHTAVDDKLYGKSPSALFGRIDLLPAEIDHYDSAIRYIDFSVAQTIEFVKSLPSPVVFVYFADHGDSVFTGRGHDSSRFVHEMLRVPFLLYFNDAAREAHPELFSKHARFARERHVATLAQFPATLLDLLGIAILKGQSATDVAIPEPVGAPTSPAPLLVRRTAEGVSYIKADADPLIVSQSSELLILDKTDDATKILVDTINNTTSAKTCYHRSNTLAKALRGQMVSDCLEVDLVVGPDGQLALYHAPAENTGFALKDVMEIITANDGSLWIDGKNLHQGKNCREVAEFLQPYSSPAHTILVEFPSRSHQNKDELQHCAAQIRKSGFFTSYYVPTQPLVSCAQALKSGGDFANEPICQGLGQDLTAAYASGLFTDISFDYTGITAIEKFPLTQKMQWNTWGVPAGTLAAIAPQRFRMVIMANADPNNL